MKILKIYACLTVWHFIVTNVKRRWSGRSEDDEIYPMRHLEKYKEVFLKRLLSPTQVERWKERAIKLSFLFKPSHWKFSSILFLFVLWKTLCFFMFITLNRIKCSYNARPFYGFSHDSSRFVSNKNFHAAFEPEKYKIQCDALSRLHELWQIKNYETLFPEVLVARQGSEQKLLSFMKHGGREEVRTSLFKKIFELKTCSHSQNSFRITLSLSLLSCFPILTRTASSSGWKCLRNTFAIIVRTVKMLNVIKCQQTP